MKEEKISIYRVLSILGIFLSLWGTTLGMSFLNSLQFDKMLCLFFIIIGFMPIIIFELGYERRRNLIGNNNQTSYDRVAFGTLIGGLFVLGISFMPSFYRPVLLLPVLLIAYSNEILGITLSFVFQAILVLATECDVYEAVLYTMLIIMGGVLAKCLKQVEYRLYISLLYLSVSVLFPNVFYYLLNEEIDLSSTWICILCGIGTAVYCIVLFPKVQEETKEEIVHRYERFLQDDYVQVRRVRAYSWSEYRHARKVSDIAFKYAKSLGFRAELAAAAGFYYRLGRWEGEPFVQNALKKGQELCFPEELLMILSEYYGEEKLPSTPESALVHIIDGLLIKLELLDKEVGTSQWNREVVIYQTLNEFSTAGLYDKSGLSINAFIKIREWLAKEELL